MSTSSVNPATSWRQNVKKYLATLLGKGKVCQSLAKEIEGEIYHYAQTATPEEEAKLFGDNVLKRRYHHKLSFLVLNLKPDSSVGNKNLLQKVLSGSLTPKQLVSSDPVELFPENWEDIRNKQKAEEKFLYETTIAATSDEYECRKCHSRNVYYEELQTRSADEAMTIFFTCLNCCKKWKQ